MARDAHAWFMAMMLEHEGFGVETDRAEELPFSFWSETDGGWWRSSTGLHLAVTTE